MHGEPYEIVAHIEPRQRRRRRVRYRIERRVHEPDHEVPIEDTLPADFLNAPGIHVLEEGTMRVPKWWPRDVHREVLLESGLQPGAVATKVEFD